MIYFEDNNYRKPLLFALALHVIVLMMLLIHFKFSPVPNPVLQNSISVIKAVAVTPNQLQNQIAKLQTAQRAELHEQQIQQRQQAQQQKQQMQQQQAERQQQLQQQEQQAEQAKQAQITAQQVAQQKLKQQQAAKAAQEKAAQQLAAQQAQAAALAAEKEKAAAQQAKHAAAVKAQQLKAKEEQKRLAQLAIQQAIQQQEQQAEQAKQTQEKQKQMQAAKLAAQQLLQQQLAATNTTPATAKTAALSAAAQGQVDKYSALIIQAIGQQWIIPDSAQKNLQGTMQVKVAPGGMVLSVTITKTSGNSAFDRSARAAVFKASPLPVPKDASVFNQFRVLNLTFQPDGIANSS